MVARILRTAFLVCSCFCVLAIPAYSQDGHEETLGGPDSHETGQGRHGHLFGEWGGARPKLEERGVRFDFQYVSDSLWNLKSEQKERFASWNRFRWTVDIDFGKGETELNRFNGDAAHKPKQIDSTPDKMPGKPLLGIYEIEGNRIKVCNAGPGKDRPTAFESKKGSGHTLVIWEREKK